MHKTWRRNLWTFSLPPKRNAQIQKKEKQEKNFKRFFRVWEMFFDLKTNLKTALVRLQRHFHVHPLGKFSKPFLMSKTQGSHSIPGPVSVDRFPGGDDEVEVDVEQCSDSEAQSRSRTPRSVSNNSRATPQSDDERLTPEPVRKKVIS